MSILASNTAAVSLYAAHLSGSAHGCICRWEQLVTSEDYCEYAIEKKKVFTEWMPSSLKTSLNATYLHYQSISLMFVVSCPSDWNKPNCSPIHFNKFTWETAMFGRWSVLFLLEKDGTEFLLISNSCQVIAHKKWGNILKKVAIWEIQYTIQRLSSSSHFSEITPIQLESVVQLM